MFKFNKTEVKESAADELYKKGCQAAEENNFADAAEFFQSAAQSDHPESCTRLAFMYGHGQYFAVDEVKEEEYLRRACEKQFAPAQAMMAFLYMNGNHSVIKQDLLEASCFLEQALQQNCPEAVGIALMGGLCNFPADLEAARDHFHTLLAEKELDCVKFLLMHTLMRLAENDPGADVELEYLLEDMVSRNITSAIFVKALQLIRQDPGKDLSSQPLELLREASAKNHADAMMVLQEHYRSENMTGQADTLLENAARQNRGQALFQLACMEMETDQDDPSPEKTESSFCKKILGKMKKAAVCESPDANTAMGTLLERFDPQKAAEAYFKGALYQQPNALHSLGRMYNSGFVTTASIPERAVTFFKEAITCGNAESHVNLGEAYMEGRGVSLDAFAGMGHFLAAARQGVPRGMYLYGKLLCEGPLGFSDEEEGMKWIMLSVENKDPDGIMFYWEKKTSGNEEISDEELEKLDMLLEEAADAGQETAQLLCGLKYLNGLGGEVDPEKALHYFMASGENGNMEAIYWVGFMNLHGIGGKANAENARSCFRKAAEGGCASAQYEYGKMLHGEKNYVYSFQLFQDASEQGHVQAMEMLSQIYANGLGIAKDEALAEEYMERAKLLKEAEDSSSSFPEEE